MKLRSTSTANIRLTFLCTIRRVLSGRKDFLEKNSRNFSEYALSEKMPHVSSDPETEKQPDLFRVRRKDPAKSRTTVQKMWPSRKNRRGILSGLPEGTALFFGRQKYIFIWRDVAAVSGTVQILRVPGIRRFLRKSHEYLWKEISGTLETTAYRSCSAPSQKEKKQRI